MLKQSEKGRLTSGIADAMVRRCGLKAGNSLLKYKGLQGYIVREPPVTY